MVHSESFLTLMFFKNLILVEISVKIHQKLPQKIEGFNFFYFRNFSDPNQPRPAYWKWILKISILIFLISCVLAYFLTSKRRRRWERMIEYLIPYSFISFFAIFFLICVVLLIKTYLNIRKVGKNLSASDAKRHEEEKERWKT